MFFIKMILGGLGINLNYQDQVNRDIVLNELRLLSTILINKKNTYIIRDADGVERTPQVKIGSITKLLITGLNNLEEKKKAEEFSRYTRQARALTGKALKLSDMSWSCGAAEELDTVLEKISRLIHARAQAHY